MLLDAASHSGLELPYSCANGMCATCRCKLSQGEGEMAQNFSLEPWEIEQGYVWPVNLNRGQSWWFWTSTQSKYWFHLASDV